MADQVDKMSDAELRTKLAEHGYPVMPITASTRKLLVKKLKLVLDKGGGPAGPRAAAAADNRRSLARYSSGEESDLDNTTTKEKKNRRATTGGAMLPPAAAKARRGTPKKDSPAKQDSDKGSESDEEKTSPVRTHEEVETVTTRRVTRTYAAPKDGDDYETGSDSDVDTERKTSSPFRSSSRSSDYISSTLPAADAAGPKTSIFSRPSVPSYTSPMSSSDHLNSIRSRLGLSTNLTERPSASNYTSSFTSPTRASTSLTDEVESPYLSNFTRRLSALKSDPPRQTSFLDRDTNNGAGLLPRRSYISGAARASAAEYKTSNDKNFLKNNLVSLALVGIVALFFFCLFFMYIVKKNDITSVVDDQNSVIPICQLNIPGSRPGINCVPKDHVGLAKDLLKMVHPELTTRAAAFMCGEPNVLPYMTEREVLELGSARAGAVQGQTRADLSNLQVLLLHNPRWGVDVVQLKGLYSKDAATAPLLSSDQLAAQRSQGTLGLALHAPATPVGCLLMTALYSAGSTIAAVLLLTLAVVGSQRLYRYYRAQQKRKNDEIYSMVEQIIDVISQETEDSGEPYISVDHVRDTLISPPNRERMSATWDAAVQFIQRNESRVRMEVQSVGGEDCRVWRWVSPRGSPPRTGGGAAWQGQAFETQEGSVNNLPVSPTNCLKIRHMFDRAEGGGGGDGELLAALTDAILDKCGAAVRLLHVAAERGSGCVYVKCASTADAGQVYRALHGWWFEGRLITVKYLRLERYMQRFPDSPSVGPYLKRRPLHK